MSIFNHARADMKNHAVAVQIIRIPAACKLSITAFVQAESRPHEFDSLLLKYLAAIESRVKSCEVNGAHIQADPAVLVLGVKKVNVVPQFAIGRCQTVPVRLPLHVEAIGLWSEVHIKPYTVRDDIERVSEASGCHT